MYVREIERVEMSEREEEMFKAKVSNITEYTQENENEERDEFCEDWDVSLCKTCANN